LESGSEVIENRFSDPERITQKEAISEIQVHGQPNFFAPSKLSFKTELIIKILILN